MTAPAVGTYVAWTWLDPFAEIAERVGMGVVEGIEGHALVVREDGSDKPVLVLATNVEIVPGGAL